MRHNSKRPYIDIVYPELEGISVAELVEWRIKKADTDHEWSVGVGVNKKERWVRKVYLPTLISRLSFAIREIREYLVEN